LPSVAVAVVAGDEADVEVGLAVGLGLPGDVEGFGVVGLAAPAGAEEAAHGVALVFDGVEMPAWASSRRWCRCW
jgi:hypothetical protein